MKCEICGRGPSSENGGITVYRQNEKGQPGVWRCRPHSQVPSDPETQRLVDIIEDSQIKDPLSSKERA